MDRRGLLLTVALAMCACQAPEEGHLRAIIGAVLIDGLGGPPLTNSIVVISGDRIAAAGRASSVPVPGEAGKLDGSGRYLAPALVPVAANVPDNDEAALMKARESGGPAIVHASRLADVVWAVDHGASAVVGIPRDTEALDPEFVAKLRDLRIAFAPALAGAGPNPGVAKKNTLRLFQGGVPIALAAGVDPQREMELMVDAGIPPLDAIVAATRNGAAALHDATRGTIEPGKRADLLLLSAHPGEDIRNLRKVALRIQNGAW